MMHPPASDSPRPSSVGSTQSSQGSSTRARGKHEICVGEELKIATDIAIERFRLSEEQKVLEFPSSLTSTERAYIHRLCQTLGIKSKSRGKGANRYLTLTKKDGSHTMHSAAVLNLARNSRHQIHSLVQRFPVTNKERQDLQPRTERGQFNEGLAREFSKTTTGRLNNGVPQVPPGRGPSELSGFRQTLPVFNMKDQIVGSMNENKVMMVSGETGSGKTTQVPQMILDECQAANRPCRIFCTQPRRLSALSVAERVAAERGEKIGQTVGYQIRLESRVSPKTLLTFCTNGVLLRTLMGGDSAMATVTHVIVDEIHERDRFCDFLLVALRDLLPRYRNLKVILMSATLNVQLFANYFGACPIIQVPGKLFDVEEHFLEDILKWTGYTNKVMEKYRKELGNVVSQQKQLDDWCNRQLAAEGATESEDAQEVEKEEGDDVSSLEQDFAETAIAEDSLQADLEKAELCQEKEELEPWLVQEMDQLLTDIWMNGQEELFNQVFHLILSENITVDYVHSLTSATPLMVAAGRGFYNVVEKLLNLGSNINVRASNDWTALDWARKFNRTDIVELFEATLAVTEEPIHDETVLVKQSQELSQEDRDLLNIYHHSFDDEKVDIDLIMALLHKIHAGTQEGAILVFLPGYDEIVTLRDKILEDRRFADSNRYILYTLHSSMQSTDQRKIFRLPPPGVRKIILSTNIAETSVTINDVVFVIDSGKVKEKSFDALTSVSMLKSHWVSKASAQQRMGRAGRCKPGVCYHLFSRVRFSSLQEYQEPEILRYPLQELCLQTKLLAPGNSSIADFLAKAPEPPAFLLIRNAVHLLKQIDALDSYEDLMELGHHLVDLPVEPQYGKMVLYSVVLKCLDPVLTIACTLAYRDPFVLPAQPSLKRAAAMSRRQFSAGTHSDHMALLRAFQAWQKSRMEGWERQFCAKNFLSSSTMEMIVGMRTQLLGQLRASGFVRARGNGDIRDLNTNSENWAVVKAALTAGMYPNIIRVDRDKRQLTTMKENKLRFHGSSVLSPGPKASSHASNIQRLPSDWLIYEEMTRAHRLAQVKCCTVVSPVTVALFSGPGKLGLDNVREAESGLQGPQGDGFLADTSDSEGEERDESRRANFRLDDWIHFKADAEASLLSMQLRQKWHSLFLRRMRAPSKPWSPMDENVIRAVVSILTNEEQSLGLQQPAGIGQRPKPMATENVVSSGGSRRGSYDTEHSDDSSNGDHGRPAMRGRPFKYQSTPPRRGNLARFSRSSEDRSETSSVRSSSSANNSGPNSLHGSAASSPCESPQPSYSPARFGPSDSGPSSDHPCRFFVMKSNNHRNLDISQQKAIWATATSIEKRLDKVYKEGRTVYLVFSVQGSGHFQGFAKMTSPVSTERCREFNAPSLGNNFCVEWIKRSNLPFQHCHHLLNPWNENKKVQISRDGQEVEPTVGQELLKLWDKLPTYQPRQSPQYQRGPGHYIQGQHSPRGNQGPSGQWSPRRGQGGRGYGGGPQRHWAPGHQGHPMPYSQMPGGYSPMYVNHPQRGQSQMMSPRQNMSPVMILQRGSTPPGQGSGSSTPPTPGSYSGGEPGGYK